MTEGARGGAGDGVDGLHAVILAGGSDRCPEEAHASAKMAGAGMSGGAMRSRSRGREAALYSACALTTAALVTVFFQLWRADLSVPLAGGADSLFGGAVIKGLTEHGSWWTNPSLGAPGVMHLYDFPSADAGNNALLWLIGVLTRDWAVTMNVFYLLGYPAAALAAAFVLRRMGVSRVAAFASSLLFAFLPYHWLRGEGHLFLVSYWTVPLAVLVAVRLATDPPLGEVEPGGRWSWRRALRDRRIVGTLAVAVALSLTGVYYAYFACFLFLVAAGTAAVRLHDARRLLPAVALAAVVTFGVVASISPSIVYHARHGSNEGALVRNPGQAEILGLKIDQLFLPVDGHRLAPAARLKAAYREGLRVIGPSLDNESNWASLGVVGAVGFLVSVLAFVFGAGRRRGRDPDTRLATLGLLNVSLVLLATVGGFGALVAAALVKEIRSYNRASVFIAFLSLATTALLFDRAVSRYKKVASRAFAYALVALILVLGLLDQTTTSMVPGYAADKAAFESDAAFVASVERALPVGAAVFQLPYMPFPEPGGPFNKMQDYDHFVGYVHSKDLRWSYGAMKGREDAEWQERVASLPVEQMIADVRARGFDGIWVDRDGYVDGGAAVESALRASQGGPAAVSDDGTLALYVLGVR